MKASLKKALRALGRTAGYEVSIRRRAGPESDIPIHFLHIGKNAGTQIKAICNKYSDKFGFKKFVMCNHDVYLKDLPKGAPYFFSIRDPIDRFRSAFYSRKRKGQPRIYSEWSAHDEKAFGDFEHANNLAESLFEGGEIGMKAFCAMKSIRHTAQNQSDWFYLCGNFLSIHPPIWIIRQEQLHSDMNVFLHRIGIKEEKVPLELEKNHVKAHKNDYTFTVNLSEKAKNNLRIWYAQDFMFYRTCEYWMNEALKTENE